MNFEVKIDFVMTNAKMERVFLTAMLVGAVLQITLLDSARFTQILTRFIGKLQTDFRKTHEAPNFS